MKQMLKPLMDWYLNSLESGGYLLVALLMAVESSIVPLPSEVVIPPAAHLAHTTDSSMSVWGIALAGTIGSWFGASVMYWISRWAGRPLVMRYGKYIFLSPEKIEGAERWAAHYGAFGIFASRLLPVVRHLIGLPAGIVKMNYWTYSLYTIIGSALWCSLLCWLGVKVGGDISKGEMHKVTYWLLGFIAIVGVFYYLFVHRHMKARKV